MDAARLFKFYRDLQCYVGWTDEDGARVVAMAPFVRPHFHALIDDFYDEISRHEDARKVITGGAAQIERLKQTLRDWIDQLFSGRYDADYVSRRWRVGWRHVEIGLNQVYTNVALSRLRSGIARVLTESWTGAPADLHASLLSLHKLLDLDLAIIEDAYQAEYLRRAQQVERLAAIGQMAGGVAHELRQPLNVIKTSVYYLLHAKKATPEKIREHLDRIDAQVGLADGVITAMANYARLPLPQLVSVPACDLIRDILSLQAIPDNVKVEVSCDHAPPLMTDPTQLTIVVGNLIRNACDAMPDGGRMLIAASIPEGAGGSTVEISVADTGVGIPRDDLDRVLEPLYTTKPRGMGLGLAIARGILDKLGGRMTVESELGQGTTFRVTLPAARANVSCREF